MVNYEARKVTKVGDGFHTTKAQSIIDKPGPSISYMFVRRRISSKGKIAIRSVTRPLEPEAFLDHGACTSTLSGYNGKV